ncbi:hypothetical protein DVR09_16990 (plasmid) [Erythrobacter aureus]|uniref:Uncharacterized protein n=1 Tax=Erythrobacter aureus TaxID=2182384 RepID=A0A345YJR3_9SPHN|nr:hypothetical protein DVR09_16990 [Erythrobacter aureus]
MFPRVREISDSFGATMRMSVEPNPSGALVVIDWMDKPHAGKLILDGYGADMLLGFIMSARLASPGSMPEEVVDGKYPTRFQLEAEPEAAVVVDQLHGAGPFYIPASLWDRTYAELCLVCAHAREMVRRCEARIH